MSTIDGVLILGATTIEAIVTFLIIFKINYIPFNINKIYWPIILLSIFTFFKTELILNNSLHQVVGMFLVYAFILILNKSILKINIRKNLKSTSIVYIAMFFSELIVSLSIGFLLPAISYDGLRLIDKVLISLVISVITYFNYFVVQSIFQIRYLLKMIKFSRSFYTVLILFITGGFMFVYTNAVHDAFMNNFYKTLLIISFIIFFIIFIFFVIKAVRLNNIVIERKQLIDYINLFENMLKKQRSIYHEHKNDLVIINDLLKNRKIKDAQRFINKSILVYDNDDNLSHFEMINNFPDSPIKTMLLNKLLEMENHNRLYELKIESDTQTIPLNNRKQVSFSKCLAIMLDNALDFANDNKIILIDFKIKHESIWIEVVNSFSNKCQDSYKPEIMKGVGLKILDGITSDNNFNYNIEIIDNLYIQKISYQIKSPIG